MPIRLYSEDKVAVAMRPDMTGAPAVASVSARQPHLAMLQDRAQSALRPPGDRGAAAARRPIDEVEAETNWMRKES